ncbi:MAG: response regulator [Chloroflexales bacterium]|nr:response regulator [Chloroflexales bacterium]
MDKPAIPLLLVEDNPADVVLLEAALETVAHATFQVTAVEQLGAALTALAARPFDVALLDLGLPDSQGLDTFTRLRAQVPTIPIVVLSGLHDEELAALAVRAGAQDYLVKGQTRGAELARVIRYAIERHQLQAQLCASEQHFRALIEHSADAVTTLTADGTISYASPAAQRILGYRPEERLGQGSFSLVHPDDLAPTLERFQQLVHRPQTTVMSELRARRKDGSWCWLEATGTNLLEVPAVRAIVVNYRDVTARKAAEAALHQLTETLELQVVARTEELHQANADLIQANAELTRAARLKDEFLTLISHELRTPISAILGHAELLQEAIYGPLTPKQSESLRSIDTSGRHLLGLITEILDLAKSEAGALQVTLAPVDIELVCQLSLQLVAVRAQQKGIALSTMLGSTVTTMLADERRLTQILVNLLANAITFTHEGGKVGLEVLGDQEQRTVTFTVWDTGIGIAEADLSRLFQPFTQLDSGLDRRYEGAGLGLALVRRLAEGHQGRVTVMSQPGEGSRFSVTLPWTHLPAPLAAGAPATASGLAPQAGRLPTTAAIQPVEPGVHITPRPTDGGARPSILLVEDRADQAQMIADFLETHGYQLRIAQNGGDALILARDKPPALVLMDIQLPGMDGLTTIRHMRAEASLQVLPILALTALALPGDRERCLAAGANAYLVKPVSLRTLLAAIQTHLDRFAEVGSRAATNPEAG